MKMKIPYFYNTYPNCPRATEISRSREKNKGNSGLITICIAIVSYILCESILAKVLVVIAAVLVLVFNILFYDKITEIMVMKAIMEQVEAEQNAQKNKYTCSQLKYLNDVGIGQCMLCYTRSVKLARYHIKTPVATRQIPICENCVQKLRENFNK